MAGYHTIHRIDDDKAVLWCRIVKTGGSYRITIPTDVAERFRGKPLRVTIEVAE